MYAHCRKINLHEKEKEKNKNLSHSYSLERSSVKILVYIHSLPNVYKNRTVLFGNLLLLLNDVPWTTFHVMKDASAVLSFSNGDM